MDSFIKHFAGTQDDDLTLCHDRGAAFQTNMQITAKYDEHYFDRYVSYEGQAITLALMDGRAALVNKYIGSNALVLDVGIGSGEFIKERENTVGIDVNERAIAWLMGAGKYFNEIGSDKLAGYCFWDVLEHVPDPGEYLRKIQFGNYAFVSIPIFEDLNKIRESKHYRPGEHLYYFTSDGFVGWMALYGFTLLEVSTFEMDAGREDIYSYVFIKGHP